MADIGREVGRLELGRVLRGGGAFLIRNWSWLLMVSVPLSLLGQLATVQIVGYATAANLIPAGVLPSLPARTLIRSAVELVPGSIFMTLVVARVARDSDRPKRSRV